MEYIHDVDVRDMIQGATNKSETFNAFVKWISFGGDGVMATNNREEQRKVIRYNRLVANLVVFHNAVAMMRIFQELVGEGYTITPEIMPLFRPTGRSI